MINVNDFDFYLPDELIAQTPLSDRTSSRLLVMDKDSGEIVERTFKDIVSYLGENDVLVLNDTRVIPARLYGIKEDTNANIELLLLKDHGHNTWEALVRPAKRVKVGTVVSFGEGKLKAICTEEKEDGIRFFRLEYDGILLEVLNELGEMPLPPYITEKLEDRNRYQTVYAKNDGSAAAPTAGLHFTKELLEEAKAKGVEVIYVTLHVGLGTFRPVSVDNVNDHVMHTEVYEITKEAADALNKAMKENKRIISVGTTTTRTLESAYDNGFTECKGSTNIFIYPGYEFKVIDALITNFHLPKSTLVMLVSALSSRENIINAYNYAVENKFRFFSFGDAMFIK